MSHLFIANYSGQKAKLTAGFGFDTYLCGSKIYSSNTQYYFMANTGKIKSVIGAVVDVQFDSDNKLHQL